MRGSVLTMPMSRPNLHTTILGIQWLEFIYFEKTGIAYPLAGEDVKICAKVAACFASGRTDCVVQGSGADISGSFDTENTAQVIRCMLLDRLVRGTACPRLLRRWKTLNERRSKWDIISCCSSTGNVSRTPSVVFGGRRGCSYGALGGG